MANRDDDSFNLDDLETRNSFFRRWINRVEHLVDEIFETRQGMTKAEARANLGVPDQSDFDNHVTQSDDVHGAPAGSDLLHDGNRASEGGNLVETDQNATITGEYTFDETVRITRIGGLASVNTPGLIGFFDLEAEGLDNDGLAYRFARNTNGASSVSIEAHEGVGSSSPWLRLSNTSGGRIGTPIGGTQGAGTWNAVELYENGNRVQTIDYVFDAYLDGQINYDHYDGLMGTQEVESEETEEVEEEEPVTEEVEVYRDEWDEEKQAFVRRKKMETRTVHDEFPVKDEEGHEIGVKRVERKQKVKKQVPRRVKVQRDHAPARRFESDDLDADAFWQKCEQFRKLPAFKRCTDNMREGQERLSTGQIMQALTETVETMSIHIHDLNERLKSLEGSRDQ